MSTIGVLQNLCECPHYGTSVPLSGLKSQRVRDKTLSRLCDTCTVDETETLQSARIAAALRAWMDAASLSIMDLHKRTGISRNTIDQYLKGSRLARIAILEAVARELGTTAGKLIDGIMPIASASAALSALQTDAGLAGQSWPSGLVTHGPTTPPTSDGAEKGLRSTDVALAKAGNIVNDRTTLLEKHLSEVLARLDALEDARRTPQERRRKSAAL